MYKGPKLNFKNTFVERGNFKYRNDKHIFSTSISVDIFSDQKGSKWFGKSSPSFIYSHSGTVKIDKKATYEEQILELIANIIYAKLDVTVPEATISECPLTNNFDFGCSESLASHILFRWIDNLILFQTQSTKGVKYNPAIFGKVLFSGKNYVTRGAGKILALGHILNDIDVVGGSCSNFGFIIKQEKPSQGYFADVVKLDHGEAFYLYKRKKVKVVGAIKCHLEHRKNHHIRLCRQDLENAFIAFKDLPEHVKNEFLETLKSVINLKRQPKVVLYQHFINIKEKPWCDHKKLIIDLFKFLSGRIEDVAKKYKLFLI